MSVMIVTLYGIDGSTVDVEPDPIGVDEEGIVVYAARVPADFGPCIRASIDILPASSKLLFRHWEAST